MSVPIFSGVGVALLTLFDSSGAVDAGATAEHASRLVEIGIQAVLVAGSTGESASLDPDEYAVLVGTVRATLPPQVPVLAGAGAPSARQAVHLTKVVLEAGADAVLALSPPRSSDAREYYELVAEAAGGASVLAYHFPAFSPPGLPVSVLPELPVVGLKDSSGDPHRLSQELDVFAGWLYVGSTNLVLLAGAMECAGAILAIANLEPELSIRAFAGDPKAQRQLVTATDAVSDRWPHGLKQAVAARFGTSPTSRMG
ncbi:MAG: dihydrodipicolinate synthase family protein [Acidimicrobiales bacterium]|jgi:4-hydroxy-tetrahydrodipicolinate synthase